MLDISACPRLQLISIKLALVCRQAGEGGPGSDSRGRRAAKGKVGPRMHSSTTVNTSIQLCQRKVPVQYALHNLIVRLVCTYDHVCER